MSSNVHRIGAYSPDADDVANALSQIKGAMADIMVYSAALTSNDCDEEVRRTVAKMLTISHNDLNVAREYLEGPRLC